ncbi:MAG: cell division protein FtsQ/DivIB [Gammaproteobacteria bacterium]
MFWRKKKKVNRRIAPRQPRHRQGRRWIDLRVLASVLLSGVLVAAAGWTGAMLSDPQTFPVRSVRVIGDFQRLSREQLQELVAPHATGGFFHADVGSMRRAVMALPWVDAVSVRRVWPDSLQILVTEQAPFARWSDKGVLNPRGEVFYPDPESVPDGLPEFAGPMGQEEAVMNAYRDMSRALAPVGLKIRRLVLDERRAWRLELDNGIELKLGRSGHYPRLVQFVRLYPRFLADKAENVRSVDFRYTNGFAVLWKGQPGMPAAGVQEG